MGGQKVQGGEWTSRRREQPSASVLLRRQDRGVLSQDTPRYAWWDWEVGKTDRRGVRSGWQVKTWRPTVNAEDSSRPFDGK